FHFLSWRNRYMRNVISSLRRVRVFRGAALACVLAGAMFVPSYAAPNAGTDVPEQVPTQQAASMFARSDLPGATDVPAQGSISDAEGTVTSSQGTVVNRSRMYITVGPDDSIWGGMYYGEFNWPYDKPEEYKALCGKNTQETCVPNPFYQPE